MSSLADHLKKSGSPERRFSHPDIRRICDLPILTRMTEAEHEAYNRLNVLAPAFDMGFRMFPDQAEAILAYELYGSLFAAIGVGFGKTLVTLMVAQKAYERGMQKILLLVPPSVFDQLTTVDIRWARARVPLTLPIHPISGTQDRRREEANSNEPGLYVMPYSLLSTVDSDYLLWNIAPKLIICDEAHNLSRRETARTQRLFRYIETTEPAGVCLSGTITSKSILDYHHLIRWCLGERSPLPKQAVLACQWANALDTGATRYNASAGRDSATLEPVREWASMHFVDKMQQHQDKIGILREAYQCRLSSAPCVISSGDRSIGTSLTMHNCPVQVPSKISNMMENLEKTWLTPNGDEIEYAVQTYKWLYELSSGFYNQLVWPSAEEYSARKSISVEESRNVLDKAEEHRKAGNRFASALRKWMQSFGTSGLDTPMLVCGSLSRGNGPKSLSAEYEEWKSLDFGGRPDRDASAVRVDSYKIDACCAWCASLPLDEGAIIWVYHNEIGRWAHEILREGKREVLYCPAGENTEILNSANSRKIVVASIMAHGTGKNLQHFRHNYFLQWPRKAVTAEQTLGRTHRSGQGADELVMVTNNSNEFDHLNFAASLNDALYIHQTTNNRQKLIYAGYDPLPKVFPSAVLTQRGLETKELNKEQEKMLAERFAR